MPGMEGGPGGGPSPEEQNKPKPAREREQPHHDADFEKLFNTQPTRGAELVPFGSAASTPESNAEATASLEGSHIPDSPAELYVDNGTMVLQTAAARAQSAAASPSAPRTATAVLDRPPVVNAGPQGMVTTTTGGGQPPQGPGPDTGIEPIRIVMTGLDKGAKNMAREAAHEELAKTPEGGFWKRMAKSAWTALTREYKTVKATQEKFQDIVDNKNVLHHHGQSDQKWREAVMDRYSSEYAEHLVQDGETFHNLNKVSAQAEDDPEAKRLKDNAEKINSDIKDFMAKVARGEVASDDDLQAMEEEMVQQWREAKISQDFIGEGQVLAMNLGRKGRELEAMINSAQGLNAVEREALLQQHLDQIEVVAGEAMVGSRAEIDPRISERVAEKLRGSKIFSEGRLAAVASIIGNETFVAAMASVAMATAGRGLSAATKFALPGLGAGIVAGIRERRALKDERALMTRRRDAGLEVEPDNKKQAKLAETLYETQFGPEAIKEIGKFYTDTGELNIVDRDDLQKALKLQGDIQARMELEAKGNSLFSWSSMEDSETERWQLTLALAKLETDLEKAMQDDTLKSTANLTGEETYAALSDLNKSVASAEINGRMKKLDVLYRKFAAVEVAKKVGVTTMFGAVASVGVHELVQTVQAGKEFVDQVATEFDAIKDQPRPDYELASMNTETPDSMGSATDAAPESLGSAESTPDSMGSAATAEGPDSMGSTPSGAEAPNSMGSQSAEQATPQGPDSMGSTAPEATPAQGPESMGSDVTNPTPEAPGSMGTAETVNLGPTTEISDHAKVTLPEGFTAESQGDIVTITTPDGQTIQGLPLEKDGTLSPQAQEALEQNGYTVADRTAEVAGQPEVTTEKLSAKEFVEANKDDMTKIHVEEWLYNGSPNPDDANMNELGLDHQVGKDGSVTLSISGMTEGGSYNDNMSVDVKEALANGDVKAYMTVGEGSQSRAFELTFDENGKAEIPKDGPLAALYNDKGDFLGHREHAAISLGEDEKGRERLASLATVIGEKEDTFTQTVSTPNTETAHHYTILPKPEPAANIVDDNESPWPFLVPPLPRRTLGEPKTPTPPVPGPVGRPPVSPLGPISNIDDEYTARTPLGIVSDSSDEDPSGIRSSAETLSNPGAQVAGAMSIGASPTATSSDNTQADDTDTSSSSTTSPDANENVDQDVGQFWSQERTIIDQIDAESRSFPLAVSAEMATLSPRQRKLLTRIAYETMQRFPRRSGETDELYDARIKTEIRIGAVKGYQKIRDWTARRQASPAYLGMAGEVFRVANQLR